MDLKHISDQVTNGIDHAYQRPALWMVTGAFLGLILWGISQANEEEQSKKSHKFFKEIVRVLINL